MIRQRFSRNAPKQPIKLIENITEPENTNATDICKMKSKILRNLNRLYSYSSKKDQTPNEINVVPISQNIRLKKNNEYLTYGDMNVKSSSNNGGQ